MYVTWIFAETKQIGITETPKVLFHRNVMLTQLQAFTAIGIWDYHHWTPKGWELYGIWAIEAAIIMVTCVIYSIYKINDLAFCERYNKWFNRKTSLTLKKNIPVSELQEIKQQLENGDCSGLPRLSTHSQSSSDSVIFNVIRCN